MTDQTPTAAVVVIGNEILSGRTQDANLAYIAMGLGEIGVRLIEARVIKDDEAAIVAAIDELRARLKTGGPRRSFPFTPSNIACITIGTPARTKTLPIWNPGARLTGFSIRVAPSGT